MTSVRTNWTMRPSCRDVISSCSPNSELRSAMVTYAPASARDVTIKEPRPEAPPVTSADFPLRIEGSKGLVKSIMGPIVGFEDRY